MTIDRLPLWLEQMHEAASQALAYVEGMDKAAFVTDKRTQQAVVLNLLVIGELAAKLLEQHGDFLMEHPGIAWASMKGMRNRIAHGYFELDIGVVWETVQRALPDLLARLPAVRVAAQERPARD
ncbi:HepT-like ribonuclease domain-containing protein [Zoogloea sp.]|uniref:HepT-like ribonuclease domain-containing protein n=1 Tax=Zoogloea sp. TaxID=49181 RepID=UPI00261E8C35|nr:HepT-like ribonuclease domain-containing protein [uncultured Zoogloea sp.]